MDNDQLLASVIGNLEDALKDFHIEQRVVTTRELVILNEDAKKLVFLLCMWGIIKNIAQIEDYISWDDLEFTEMDGDTDPLESETEPTEFIWSTAKYTTYEMDFGYCWTNKEQIVWPPRHLSKLMKLPHKIHLID